MNDKSAFYIFIFVLLTLIGYDPINVLAKQLPYQKHGEFGELYVSPNAPMDYYNVFKWEIILNNKTAFTYKEKRWNLMHIDNLFLWLTVETWGLAEDNNKEYYNEIVFLARDHRFVPPRLLAIQHRTRVPTPEYPNNDKNKYCAYDLSYIVLGDIKWEEVKKDQDCKDCQSTEDSIFCHFVIDNFLKKAIENYLRNEKFYFHLPG